MSAIPVRVALRIRPLSSKEIDNGCDTAIDKVTGRSQVTIRNSEKAFTYDYAFSTDSQQSDVYDSVKPLINQLFQGKHFLRTKVIGHVRRRQGLLLAPPPPEHWGSER
jgi:kinesin family protein 4/21/27